MYELYSAYCEEKNIASIKKHMYRFIFEHDFNIELQKLIYVIHVMNTVM